MNKSAWKDLAFYFNKPITVQAEFYIKGKRLTAETKKEDHPSSHRTRGHCTLRLFHVCAMWAPLLHEVSF